MVITHVCVTSKSEILFRFDLIHKFLFWSILNTLIGRVVHSYTEVLYFQQSRERD